MEDQEMNIVERLQSQVLVLESVARINMESEDARLRSAGRYLLDAIGSYGNRMSVQHGIPLVNFDRGSVPQLKFALFTHAEYDNYQQWLKETKNEIAEITEGKPSEGDASTSPAKGKSGSAKAVTGGPKAKGSAGAKAVAKPKGSSKPKSD